MIDPILQCVPIINALQYVRTPQGLLVARTDYIKKALFLETAVKLCGILHSIIISPPSIRQFKIVVLFCVQKYLKSYGRARNQNTTLTLSVLCARIWLLTA